MIIKLSPKCAFPMICSSTNPRCTGNGPYCEPDDAEEPEEE